MVPGAKLLSAMDWISTEAHRALKTQGYSDWVDNLPQLVDQVIKQAGLTAIEPLYGGKGGALIKARDSSGRLRVLKLLPPGLAAGQLAAAEALSGNSFPTVYQSDIDQGWMVIEFLEGRAPERGITVDIPAALAAIAPIWDCPLPVYQRSFQQLFTTWLVTDHKTPAELTELASFVAPLTAAAAVEPWHHLHGDIGIHNLFLTSDGQMLFLDPAGVVGPRSWDLGCLAAWNGDHKQQTYNHAIEIAELVNADPLEVLRWAVIRIIASALLGFQRGADRQADECQRAAELLLAAHSQLLTRHN